MQYPYDVLTSLGLTDAEVEVYLALRQGVERAADIVKTTGRKRPTVYYALDSLLKRGLISKTGASDAPFRAESPERLIAIANERKVEAMDALAGAAELAAHFETAEKGKGDHPAVAFYEGVNAVKRIVMESLYCAGKEIAVIAPQENFLKHAGPGFRAEYIQERVRRKIHTRSLWEGKADTAVIKKYYAGLSAVRVLPDVMRGRFESTIFLFDDKTLYISSRKDAYCILVTSKEHHATMQALFDGLWAGSKPHPGLK
jgi:sugar-specific transcriptional regulator TrmB